MNLDLLSNGNPQKKFIKLKILHVFKS